MSSNYEWQRLEVRERINRPMREAQSNRMARREKKVGPGTLFHLLKRTLALPFRITGVILGYFQANQNQQPSEVAE